MSQLRREDFDDVYKVVHKKSLQQIEDSFFAINNLRERGDYAVIFKRGVQEVHERENHKQAPVIQIISELTYRHKRPYHPILPQCG